MKFKNWDCNLKLASYYNGNTAIQLFDKIDGEPIAVATINLGDKLPENQAYIKDYSENEGMLDSLEEAGIITKILDWQQTGYVIVPLCELDLEKIGELNG